ncbi:MAG: hypothetical protein ACI3T9_00975 [Romboutsia timonensis]
MKSLLDLKKELKNGQVNNLYVFTGEETAIRKIYYQKIAELYGKLRYLESVDNLYKELEKKSLFKTKTVYLVYNDEEYLKQKEKVYERLLSLANNNVVILVYDEIPEKSLFNKFFNDYITVFNRVADDVAIKYVNKECPKIIDRLFAEKIAFNCNNLYGSIIEEVNKYKYLTENNDDAIDALTYSTIFFDKIIIPTPREFADMFITLNRNEIAKNFKILKDQNILGYLPELYNTVSLALYFKLYGKWDGGSIAYNAGEYWGRVKQLREYNIPYTKNDLLDIRYLLNKLDIDIRKGTMPAVFAWDYLIGVIL